MIRVLKNMKFNQIRFIKNPLRNLNHILKMSTSAKLRSNQKCFDVYNPATGKVIDSVPDMNVEDAKKAVETAKNAFYSSEWSNLTGKERSSLLKVNNY